MDLRPVDNYRAAVARMLAPGLTTLWADSGRPIRLQLLAPRPAVGGAPLVSELAGLAVCSAGVAVPDPPLDLGRMLSMSCMPATGFVCSAAAESGYDQ